MIVYCLLKCEDTSKFQFKNKTNSEGDNHDNWYRYLLNDIISGCENNPSNINNNKLKIVTFNYDMSLDFYLYEKIQSIEVFKGDIGDEFISRMLNEGITHVLWSIIFT